jgi:hypothetical protein
MNVLFGIYHCPHCGIVYKDLTKGYGERWALPQPTRRGKCEFDERRAVRIEMDAV